ncbi:hypothetical protein ACFC93_06375, partial [Enterococcus faecium]
MKLTFKPLEKKDYKKAIYFAVEGMNFERYMGNELLLNLYGRYFLYMELNRATQILALYAEDELAGVGMATVFLTNFIRCRTSFRMLFRLSLTMSLLGCDDLRQELTVK